MHTINVLTFGSINFNTSLEELKDDLNFKLTFSDKEISEQLLKNHDILMFHQDGFKGDSFEKILKDSKKIKILVSYNSKKKKDQFNEVISLPVKISDLNQIVENAVMKKNFIKNSSILIKQYKLDKNEKKLIKDKDYILLTEKEIQLLELFLDSKKPISKNVILKEVWKYSTSADTHTVETHIYRLRKKISNKFNDNDFIISTKLGYNIK